MCTFWNFPDGEEDWVSTAVTHVEERDQAAAGPVRVLDPRTKFVQHVPARTDTAHENSVYAIKGISSPIDRFVQWEVSIYQQLTPLRERHQKGKNHEKATTKDVDTLPDGLSLLHLGSAGNRVGLAVAPLLHHQLVHNSLAGDLLHILHLQNII